MNQFRKQSTVWRQIFAGSNCCSYCSFFHKSQKHSSCKKKKIPEYSRKNFFAELYSIGQIIHPNNTSRILLPPFIKISLSFRNKTMKWEISVQKLKKIMIYRKGSSEGMPLRRAKFQCRTALRRVSVTIGVCIRFSPPSIQWIDYCNLNS